MVERRFLVRSPAAATADASRQIQFHRLLADARRRLHLGCYKPVGFQMVNEIEHGVWAPSPVTSSRSPTWPRLERAHRRAGLVDHIIARRRAARWRRAGVRATTISSSIGIDALDPGALDPVDILHHARGRAPASKPISEPPSLTPIAASTCSGRCRSRPVILTCLGGDSRWRAQGAPAARSAAHCRLRDGRRRAGHSRWRSR